MDIIREFELAHLVGYFTTDNAGSNDTLLETLEKTLLVEYGARFNPKKQHVRCLGHIINLSLSAFLFANNKTALEEALKEAIEGEEETSVCELLIEKLKDLKGSKGRKNKKRDDFTGWRSIGALGKLHNIAVRIKTSDILSDHWRQLSPNLMLGIDNATRWNSWYLLVKRAVSKRSEVMEICRRHKTEFGDGKDILTEEEWEQLEGTEEFLQPFYQATLEGQHEFASLDQTLLFMDIIFKHFETAKVRDPIIQPPDLSILTTAGRFNMQRMRCSRTLSIWAGFSSASTTRRPMNALYMRPPSSYILLAERNISTPIGLKNGDHLHLNRHVQSGRGTKIVQLPQGLSRYGDQISHRQSLTISAVRSMLQTVMKGRMSLRNSFIAHHYQYRVHHFNGGLAMNRELTIHAYIVWLLIF